MSASPIARKIATAARRILESGGADAVSMRRVGSAVGVTPMAIYRHYSDREALMNAIADEGFTELAASLGKHKPGGDILGRLAGMAEIYLDHALDNPRLFELMFLRPRQGARRFPQDFKARRSPTATPLYDVVAAGIESGELRNDDPWEIVFEMGALSHGLIMLYLGGRLDLSVARFRAYYRRSFARYFHGICA